MSFNKRHITVRHLLEKYQSVGLQDTINWVVKPDALFIKGQGNCIASQFVKLITNGKEAEAEKLLQSSLEEIAFLQSQLQNLVKTLGEVQNEIMSREYMLTKIQEVKTKMDKFYEKL